MKSKHSIETEYKFIVKYKDRLITILDKIGTNRANREYQKSVMFDNKQGVMQTSNARIRLRTFDISNLRTLTYKKPLAAIDGAKRETEYEVELIDGKGVTEKILEAMEFKPTTSYECYRTKWQVDEIVISLDEYPFSIFIEIEGPPAKIKKLALSLGFDVKESLTKPVDTLFQEWRALKRLSFNSHMTFNDFNK